MELKKVIALSFVTLSLGGVTSSAFASTTGVGTQNNSWTYGKNTSTTAISNLLDKVRTHSSDVWNDSTETDSSTIYATAGTVSYATVAASSSNSIMYSCSDYASVLSTK